MTLEATLATHAGQLLQKANVVGVGIGIKVKGRRKTDKLCITVMVAEKLPLQALAPADIVPASIAGYPTDVITGGPFQALSTQQPTQTAAPGMSIGHYRITAGTFGAVVYDQTSAAPLILSNNHVLANSSNGRDHRAYIGDPILLPGPIDGGRLPDSLIAKLARFQALTFLTANQQITTFNYGPEGPMAQLTNLVDAAVAQPVPDKSLDPEILGIGPVTGTREAELDLLVQKSGRTTGVTQGIILLLRAAVRVSYGAAGTAIFTDQIISDLPSAPGDSGSLVVDNERRAVGLLFAGGGGLTICNPISHVERLLQISMLPI
ncbi:MAG: hypothetical protein GX033_01620 [Firmicutes bacterium]|nr:hypothetical protein [Bacillota bacterium]